MFYHRVLLAIMALFILCHMNMGKEILYATPLISGLRDQDLWSDSIWNSNTAPFDTNRICALPEFRYPGGSAIGSYFKGTSDDTIRVVNVQTYGAFADSVFLIIATDTSTIAFGADKFRVEKLFSTTASGLIANPVALGSIDSDDYTDIVFGCWNYAHDKIVWLEWDTAMGDWAVRDSLLGVSRVFDITIGDADNDGNANEIFATSSNSTSRILRAVWTGSGWDTTFISGFNAEPQGIAIDDVRPDLSGNEIYVACCNYSYPVASGLWMVHWNGSSWDSELITGFQWPPVSNQFSNAKDVAVGDVDPTHPGNEVCVVHIHGGGGMPYPMPYQISMFNWDGVSWQARAWHWDDPLGIGADDIEIGDIIAENPGDEALVAALGTAIVFWIAPNGSAWVNRMLSTSYYEKVAIGNINKFRDLNDEFALSGVYGLLDVEQHDFTDDIGMYYFRMSKPTSVISAVDTIAAAICNAGSREQSNFTVGYHFKNSPLKDSMVYSDVLMARDTGVVRFPITMDFLGMDTLFMYTRLSGDANTVNDTLPLHIEVYAESTKVASGFNPRIFPPVNGTSPPYDWASVRVRGIHWSLWFRDDKPDYPPGPPLEGAGARAAGHGAVRYQSVRLRTHEFNTGEAPCSLFVRFYSWHANWTVGMDPETLVIEYSFDDITYTSVWRYIFPDNLPYYPGWYAWDVELGEFDSNTDMYVGIRATSGGGGTDFFIDSVRVFARTSPGVDESSNVQGFPDRVVLRQNAPNPFNRTTHISFGVPNRMTVKIAIYNVLGQLITTIVDKTVEPGYYTAMWDGTDSKGLEVSGGIYFVHMTTPELTIIRKAAVFAH